MEYPSLRQICSDKLQSLIDENQKVNDALIMYRCFSNVDDDRNLDLRDWMVSQLEPLAKDKAIESALCYEFLLANVLDERKAKLSFIKRVMSWATHTTGDDGIQ